MAFLLGVDEAGYGPNLGPLVVSVSAWRVPDDLVAGDLYAALAPVVTAAGGEKNGHLRIADSKALYSPAIGLGVLELGLLCSARLADLSFPTWRDCWRALAPHSGPWLDECPWYRGFDGPSPCAAAAGEVESTAAKLADAAAAADLQLVRLQSRAVFPAEFNGGLSEYGNKAALLSHVTLELVSSVLADLPAEPTRVVCDKHGGRNRYLGLLQHFFPDRMFNVLEEGRAASRYCLPRPGGRLDIEFRASRFCPRRWPRWRRNTSANWP